MPRATFRPCTGLLQAKAHKKTKLQLVCRQARDVACLKARTRMRRFCPALLFIPSPCRFFRNKFLCCQILLLSVLTLYLLVFFSLSIVMNCFLYIYNEMNFCTIYIYEFPMYVNVLILKFLTLYYPNSF